MSTLKTESSIISEGRTDSNIYLNHDGLGCHLRWLLHSSFAAYHMPGTEGTMKLPRHLRVKQTEIQL